MNEPHNDTLLRALRRQPTAYTPVWIMRQAGRYLPEYRRLRAEAGDFMSLCRNPELACEATMQPLRRFPLDAAILFSDILTIPDAMGLGLYFSAGEGPRFERPVRSESDIGRLAAPAMDGELRYVVDAVARIRRELAGRVPLIGFAGSPWTLATYMIEGRSTRSFALSKRLLWDQPAAAHKLLAVLAAAVTDYLNAQIAAGAQAVMVFDTWGGILSPALYREFSLEYLSRVVAGLDRGDGPERVPVILFTKGAGSRLGAMVDSGCDALGVDWTVDLAEARALTRGRVALQGNLDPAALYASPQAIRREVASILDSYGAGPGHVFNLGHGVAPDVNPDHVAALVSAVHELSRERSSAPAE